MTYIILFSFWLAEKVRDEKFNKLKDVYMKLREEHIPLLRQVSRTRCAHKRGKLV